MYKGQPSKPFTLPSEYRKAADRLFPKDGLFKSQNPDLKAIAEFSKVLGIGVEYQRLITLDKQSKELQVFLEHFQNNLDLLIKKTWVEKSDESRKYTLQDKVPVFMEKISQGEKIKSVNTILEFSDILDELAYLLFGAQSEKEDFTEYTFRIDVQMGLFWWYASKLSLLKDIKDEKISWAILLLGLCYLTNF